MRTPLTRRLASWVLLAGVAIALAARPAAPQVEPTLDARLSRKALVEQTEGTLGEYAGHLTTATKVGHRVREPFDERSLVALDVDLTLARLQRALGRVMQLTWDVSEDQPQQYTLIETRGDRQARANARTMVIRRARQRMEARWEEVRRMAFLPRQELLELAGAGDSMARSLAHPRGQPIAQVIFQLPEGVQRQFWETGTAQVTVASLLGEQQALVARSARQDLEDPSIVAREGVIHLRFGGTLDRPTVWARLQYGPDAYSVNMLYAEAWARHSPEERRREAEAAPSRVPPDPRFKQKVTLRDPVHRSGPYIAGERPPKASPLAEFLGDLADQLDLPMLAECEYRSKDAKWLGEQWWLAADLVEQPLARALDLLCADFEYEWRFRDGVLLLRPRLWFVSPEERGYVFPKR